MCSLLTARSVALPAPCSTSSLHAGALVAVMGTSRSCVPAATLTWSGAPGVAMRDRMVWRVVPSSSVDVGAAGGGGLGGAGGEGGGGSGGCGGGGGG